MGYKLLIQSLHLSMWGLESNPAWTHLQKLLAFYSMFNCFFRHAWCWCPVPPPAGWVQTSTHSTSTSWSSRTPPMHPTPSQVTTTLFRIKVMSSAVNSRINLPGFWLEKPSTLFNSVSRPSVSARTHPPSLCTTTVWGSSSLRLWLQWKTWWTTTQPPPTPTLSSSSDC